MTTKNFLSILKQIIIDYQFVKGRQMNSFSMVWEWPNLQIQSWGKVYEDFVAGAFWSRHWVNEGANPDTVKGDWPGLFVEPGDVKVNWVGSSKEQKFTLLFVDKMDCEGCGVRSGEEVRQGLLGMIEAFVMELYRYQKVRLVGGEEVWMSLGRLMYVEDEELLDIETSALEDIGAYLDISREIEVKNWAPMGDLVGMFFEVEVVLCDEMESVFNYSRPAVEELAVVKCKSC